VITCRELIEFLWKYLSGELPEDERFEFDAHLAVCPACVAYLRTYQATIQLGKVAFEDADEAVLANVPEELVSAILNARGSDEPR
jgi:anti-sigma factor RsiW